MLTLTDKQISLLSWVAFGLALTLLTLVVSNAFLETQTEFLVTQQHLSEPIARRAAPPMDTATWKTYRNEQYGFEFKYPSSFGNLTEDGAYFRFSGNKNFFLYTSSAPAKSNNPSQAKDQCGTLANSFLYCRYVPSADNKWIFIQAQHVFQDVEFALSALSDPLPKSKDTNYATYLNFFLEPAELASIRYADRIKMTKEDLSEETKRTIDEFDQILSTFKFIEPQVRQDIIYSGTSAYNGWTETQMKNHCSSLGGIFNPCGSACFDPEEICIQACVPRCEFKSDQ